MLDKSYKLTKVKKLKDTKVNLEFFKSGHEVIGSFFVKPVVGSSFIFIRKTNSKGMISSTVKEVDTEVEPGITFITTRNSIYKIEETNDSN